MLLHGEKLKAASYSSCRFPVSIRLMYRHKNEAFPTQPRLEVGQAARTKRANGRGLNIAGKQNGSKVLGLVFLLMVFLQFPAWGTASVTLVWSPSANSSVAGYNIYYGGASRTYTNKISVGNMTNVVISGLVEGTTCYFAATTYSVLGIESSFSGELVYFVPVPTLNQPPTLNAINNLTVAESAGSQTVSLSDITSGSAAENQTLTVTATSSDTNLIHNLVVNYTSPNTSGSLTFTPVAYASGTAIISVTVNDGQPLNHTVLRTFTVTVATDTSHYLIINPLANLVAIAGQTATFTTITNSPSGGKKNIGGTLSYQWKFNGTNLASSTNSTLTLSNISTNQAGIYSVTAVAVSSSGSRSTTSQTATLTVYATAAPKLAPVSHVSGQYALALAGVPGFKYVVQASTNLVNWVPLQTNTAPFTFVDGNAGSFRQRFYRSVYAP